MTQTETTVIGAYGSIVFPPTHKHRKFTFLVSVGSVVIQAINFDLFSHLCCINFSNSNCCLISISSNSNMILSVSVAIVCNIGIQRTLNSEEEAEAPLTQPN